VATVDRFPPHSRSPTASDGGRRATWLAWPSRLAAAARSPSPRAAPGLASGGRAGLCRGRIRTTQNRIVRLDVPADVRLHLQRRLVAGCEAVQATAPVQFAVSGGSLRLLPSLTGWPRPAGRPMRLITFLTKRSPLMTKRSPAKSNRSQKRR
jgi:hypothetical protein